MKFGYAILYAPDVAGALAFYEKAFGLERRFLHETGTYGELATGDTTLAFASEDMIAANGLDLQTTRPDRKAPAAEIGFVTDDVASAVARAIAAGASLARPPVQKPWGQTVAWVRDLNGFLVEICTPVG